MSLGREDYLALATIPLAALSFAFSKLWINSVERIADTPLNKKINELTSLQQQAEELNRTATFALHSKKMREVTKLQEELDEMKAKRNRPRRKFLLTICTWLIELVGLFFLRFATTFFGHKVDGAFTPGAVMPLDEIVMVPHLFTSKQMSVDPQTMAESRHALFPFLENLRSLGYIVWYFCCLISVRVLYGAFAAGVDHRQNTAAASASKVKHD